MAASSAQATTRSANEKPTPRDFRREVTDSIVQMLEKGVAPWQKPWEPGAVSLGVPFNPTSERAYRGGNAIHLIATALRNGYEDPRWMTYKQAADQGWQIRKGEKGTQIEFWEVKPTNREDQPASLGGSTASESSGRANGDRPRFIHRVYTVFNATQIDNVPAYAPPKRSEFEVIQAGEQILANSGTKIAHDQPDRAFYSRSQDSIHLPPKDSFKESAGYYGTALHELAHWTGHPSRLNRTTLNESYRFGDLNYAKEELRAELASVFLAAERGIPHHPEQHAAYVGSWVTALKEDKNEIFRAAHDASAATDFLLTLERDRSIADEELATGLSVNLAATSSSPAAILDGTAADLRHDRERLDEGEPDRSVNDGNEPVAPVRESTEEVARLEPGSSTVNVHAKQAGTDRRSTVETQPVAPIHAKGALAETQSITSEALGPKAKALAAQTESGAYRGQIIGETEQFVVQRQSSRFSVAHPKALLDRHPETGESVSISYSGLRGSVREYRERSRSQQRER
jgi:antirestriction protein ArdC